MLLMILFLCFNFYRQTITGAVTLDYYTLTKAICNKTNYCQDYYVSCNGGELIEKIPVTGAVIQHSQNWKDPRNETEINNLCD